SARWAGPEAGFIVSAVALLIAFILSVAAGRGQTKTHGRCQPWVLVEISSSDATSSHGTYDGACKNQQNLSRELIHGAEGSSAISSRSSADSLLSLVPDGFAQ